MTITVFAFYLFACTAVAAGLLVVLSRNPVHSVLWLILTFFSAAGLGLLIGIVLLMELGLVFGNWAIADSAPALREAVAPAPTDTHNTVALGNLIYTKYIYLFQTSALILLVAMVGAIVLTLRHRTDVKRQNILEQIYRDPAKTMKIKDVKPGQGL